MLRVRRGRSTVTASCGRQKHKQNPTTMSTVFKALPARSSRPLKQQHLLLQNDSYLLPKTTSSPEDSHGTLLDPHLKLIKLYTDVYFITHTLSNSAWTSPSSCPMGRPDRSHSEHPLAWIFFVVLFGVFQTDRLDLFLLPWLLFKYTIYESFAFSASLYPLVIYGN